MQLTTLTLEQFRNYKAFSLEIPKETTRVVILGNNAQGKTNLLESIYMLALAKSFRSKRTKDFIQWKTDYARIKAEITREEEDRSTELELFLSQPKKNTKKNGINIPTPEFIGTLKVVLFNPEDMNLLALSPSIRRRYLNILASQINPRYFNALLQYNKVLKHRNHLLAQIQNGKAKEEECFFWDQELIKNGVILTKGRQEIVDYLNEVLTENYRAISGKEEKVKVKYTSALNASLSPEELQNQFSLKLLEKRTIDIRYSHTSIGPHRDDLTFILNGQNIESHGSRGECRTLLIGLKLAEISFIKEKTAMAPILLLDDVFSELDHTRQQRLLENISDCQAFITTATFHDLEEIEGVKVVTIEEGGVKIA